MTIILEYFTLMRVFWGILSRYESQSFSFRPEGGGSKLAKPVSKSNSGSKLVGGRTQPQQHGTGPYERTTKQPATSIPYVGKKRPAGVLKSPDTRSSMLPKANTTTTTNAMPRPQTTTSPTRSKPVKERGSASPRSSSTDGGCAPMPRALKRNSLQFGKSQGCGDLTKVEAAAPAPHARRQTIGTGTPSKYNNNNNNNNNNSNTTSGLRFQGGGAGVRPRSSCTNNDTKPNAATKAASKRNMSKSLQCLPKACDGNSTPPPATTGLNKPLNKFGQKSVSNDNISCTGRTSGLKKPTAGGAAIPRSRSGLPKFGFNRATSTERVSTTETAPCHSTVSTPQHPQHKEPLIKDHNLSPILGTPASQPRAHNLQDTFSKAVAQNLNDYMDDEEQSAPSPPSTTPSTPSTPSSEHMEDVSAGGSNGRGGGGGGGGSADMNDTKQINIIINLDSMSTSEAIDPTSSVATPNHDNVNMTKTMADGTYTADRTYTAEGTYTADGTYAVDDCVADGTYENIRPGIIRDRTFDKAEIKNRTFDQRTVNKNRTFEKVEAPNRTFDSKNRTFEADVQNQTYDEVQQNRTFEKAQSRNQTFEKMDDGTFEEPSNEILNQTHTLNLIRTHSNDNMNKTTNYSTPGTPNTTHDARAMQYQLEKYQKENGLDDSTVIIDNYMSETTTGAAMLNATHSLDMEVLQPIGKSENVDDLDRYEEVVRYLRVNFRFLL